MFFKANAAIRCRLKKILFCFSAKLGVVVGGLDAYENSTGIVPGVELPVNLDSVCEGDGRVTVPDPGIGVYGAPMAYFQGGLVSISHSGRCSH